MESIAGRLRSCFVTGGSGFFLPCARSDGRYPICRWLTLALEEEALCFGGEFFHLWLGICNLTQLLLDEVYARSSFPADFRNVSKSFQYLRRLSAPLERHARYQLECLVPYPCVETFPFTEFARVSLYVPLPPSWASIEVPMGYAALLLSCISYLGCQLSIDASSGLWDLMYTGWAASCARHLLCNAYEYQRLW